MDYTMVGPNYAKFLMFVMILYINASVIVANKALLTTCKLIES